MMSLRRLSTLSFARKHLAPGSRDIATRLDLPMLADIADTIDRDYGIFLVFAPVQTFKSLLAQLLYVRTLCLRPVRTLWYHATDKTVDAFHDEKLSGLLDTTPITRLLYHDRNQKTKSRLSLPSGEVYRLLSANVLLNRNSKSAQDLFLDESWTFDPEWFSQIADRRSSYKHFWREIHTNTGPTADHPLDQLRLASDQREWHMRCPTCTRLFLPEFGRPATPDDPGTPGGIRYDSRSPAFRHPDGRLNEEHIHATTRYECPHCHTQHPYSEQMLIAMNGTAAAPRGLYVAMNPTPTRGITSWWCHEIALKNWGALAIAWIKANDAKARGDLAPLEEVIRKRFARPWNAHAHFSARRARRATGYTLATLTPADAPPGSPPTTWHWPDEGRDKPGRPLRFAGVDVQLDHYVLVIRAWNRRGQSRLVYCQKVTGADELSVICATHGVVPDRVWLDARHKPQEVRRLCARYGWRCVMGEAANKDYSHPILGPDGQKVIGHVRRIYSEHLEIDPFQGTAYAGGKRVVQVMFCKSAALERLHLLRTLDTNDGIPLWTDADDAPAWYREEVDAFHRIQKKSSDGSTYTEWVPHGPDHAADAEAIITIAASIAGLCGSESLTVEPTPSPNSHLPTPTQAPQAA